MPAKPTARKIAEAARRLLDQEGAEAVTMRRVANAVGITPMALYRHFPNRDGLLNALADAGFEELAARLEVPRSGDLRKRMTQVLEIHLDHALRYPRLFELMFLKRREGARRYPEDFEAGLSPTANPMAELLKAGMEAGYFRKDNVWEIVLEMGALLQGMVMLYLGGRLDMTPTRFRSCCRRSFERYINGIRS